MISKRDRSFTQGFGRVAVVMGGWSAEREISLRSGAAVLDALLSAGVDAHPVDADRSVADKLATEKFTCAFLILHGRGGEDGYVQGALELAGISYTGSDVLGSALAMDKIKSKQICRSIGIQTADWFMVETATEAIAAAERLGYPAIVKPVSEGSSIGVSRVSENAVVEAFEAARQYGDVMVERFVKGTEATVAVLNGKALPVVSMETPNLFYDYDAKYFSDDTHYECPANLPQNITEEMQLSALKAFDALGARDWGRVDFMVDEAGEHFFMELNTAPGMTDHSLVPMAANAVGVSFQQLCLEVLSMAVARGVTQTAVPAHGAPDVVGEVG